jgi:ligand-binding SRPBCC domain-containing protein
LATIRLSVEVRAPVERCFDLARSVDFHLASTPGTGERVVAGRQRGLLALDDEVTWEARHFGVRQRLTSRITQFSRPTHFRDSQVAGAFKWFHHDHHFEAIAVGTRITDVFQFQAPLGLAGRLAELLVLTAYMRRFLARRLALLREAVESERWRDFLTGVPG